MYPFFVFFFSFFADLRIQTCGKTVSLTHCSLCVCLVLTQFQFNDVDVSVALGHHFDRAVLARRAATADRPPRLRYEDTRNLVLANDETCVDLMSGLIICSTKHPVPPTAK